MIPLKKRTFFAYITYGNFVIRKFDSRKLDRFKKQPCMNDPSDKIAVLKFQNRGRGRDQGWTK